ncbi:hypothetical protein SDC9_144904 [bioreactor metagenome]|uniref:Uncharacterized protein n=1 Tax=bioreactor metagenome TaxID=1076179 RepID=A0A645E7C8_9ZZZZ
MGVSGQTVGIAHAAPDGGALRKHQQIVPGLDGLHGSFDRLDIVAAPADGKRAHLAHNPA